MQLLAAPARDAGERWRFVYIVQHLSFTSDWAGLGVIALGVVALFVFALVLETVYAATDTLVAPWLIHVCGDVAMMGIAVELLLGGRT